MSFIDIPTLLQSGTTNPWLLLPFAVLVGALHALEPGHSKSMMAAFLIANKGTRLQAVILGISAAISHSIIVFVIALIGLYLNDLLILDRAKPYLHLLSGLIILVMAAQMAGLWHKLFHHSHEHTHTHGHNHSGNNFDLNNQAQLSNKTVAWFGFSGGLAPCPAAITVLILCIQVKAFALGISMVFAFSLGLAVTFVAVGIIAVYSAGKAKNLDIISRFADKIPLILAGIMAVIGFIFLWKGLAALYF